MNQNIHCLVSNCHYWSHGNKCEAEEIIVVNDKFGAAQPDQIDAQMASQLTPSTADSCMSTCCKTFAHSGTSEINMDGVKRK